MITGYQIVDSRGNVIETLNSREEVDYYITNKRDSDRHETYTVEEVQHSTVKPGWNRPTVVEYLGLCDDPWAIVHIGLVTFKLLLRSN